MTEGQARKKHGDGVKVHRWEMARTDRAVCENDTDGFIKVVARGNGTILGATIVAARAGEVITEFVLSINQGLEFSDLAATIHAYPTYSTGVQQLAADVTLEATLGSAVGKLMLTFSRGWLH